MPNEEYNKIQATKITTKILFSPAKNIEEANIFAQKNLGVPNASYKGIHIDVANEWNRGLLETFTKFPELKKNFSFVGEMSELKDVFEKALIPYLKNEYAKKNSGAVLSEENAKKIVARVMSQPNIKIQFKVPRDVIASSRYNSDGVWKSINGVTINKYYGDSPDFIKIISEQSVANKFHPQGCTTIRSHLDHEIGHQLDKLLGLRDMPEVQKIFESRVIISKGVEDFSKITNELSEYAWNHNNSNRYAEFIAEAWAEYCNNPEPREMARKIGEIIEREYTKKFS